MNSEERKKSVEEAGPCSDKSSVNHSRLRGSDITGLRSGKLVAIEPTEQKRRGATLWRCRCDCGRELLTEAYKIRGQKITSCGCIRTEKKIKNLSGRRFGRLTAVERLEKKKGSNYLWLCICDCGKTITVPSGTLLSGHTVSCGCSRSLAMRETNRIHGTIVDHVTLIEDTCVEKIASRKLHRNNTSGFTGVQARGDKWIAVITFQKKVYYLGIYSRIEDAVRVRKDAEEALFGEFLRWYEQRNRETPDEKSDSR